MITYAAIRDGLLSGSDDTAKMALLLDQLANQITESPGDCQPFIDDALAGDDALLDPGAIPMLRRAITANSMLLDALKNLRQSLIHAQATAHARDEK